MEDVTIQEIRRFNRFYTQIIGLLDRHIIQSPFSLPEARVLYELHAQQPTTASSLVESLKMDKGLLSRILSAFEKKKFLHKEKSVTDGRSFLLQLTPAGEQAFGNINTAANQQIRTLISDKTHSEQQKIMKAMQTLQHVFGTSATENKKLTLDDLIIRTELQSGDLGYMIQMHGQVYQEEYEYGISFESYVAGGVAEFYQMYDPAKSRIWIAEHQGLRVGFLVLLDRGEVAQLRYFLLDQHYRGIGLGKRLMELFMEFLRAKKYSGAYLWTVDGLPASAALYRRHGFQLTEERPSSAFGKPLTEQRYDLKW